MNEDDEFLFAGLKVLDVGTWIAGPVSATMLADFGADVIKIEQPGVGDAYRNLAGNPGTPNANVNYAWAMDARNKRSLALNLKTQEGMDILLRLVADCDVYITNHPQAMRRQLGLTYEDLAPLNRRMIYGSLTAYGEEGPEKDREGFDLVAYWARTGLMDLVRPVGGEPAQSLPGMGDHPTAVAMYANIVTALLRRERTGKGGFVHTSLLANGLWSGSCIGQAHFAGADFSNYRQPGHAHFTRALYETSDARFLQFTMLRTVDEFDRFVLAIDALEILEDPRFASFESRFEHGTELTVLLRDIVGKRTAVEWTDRFRAGGVPASLVGVMAELPHDEQILINDMAVKPVDDVGMSRVIRDPLNVEGVPRVGVRKAPDIGEHTSEILAEMGFSNDEIVRLGEAGVTR
jgi:crotonobetainyl-CoA:carnitine CoA-transferase CaiB-like acyl-CoA transferase